MIMLKSIKLSTTIFNNFQKIIENLSDKTQYKISKVYESIECIWYRDPIFHAYKIRDVILTGNSITVDAFTIECTLSSHSVSLSGSNRSWNWKYRNITDEDYGSFFWETRLLKTRQFYKFLSRLAWAYICGPHPPPVRLHPSLLKASVAISDSGTTPESCLVTKCVLPHRGDVSKCKRTESVLGGISKQV